MCADANPISCQSTEYSHLFNEYSNEQGKVDATLFAEITAKRIVTACDVTKAQIERWVPMFTSYVDNIVRESGIGLSATIVAAAVIEHYFSTIFAKSGVRYDVAGVCRLFLAAYMSAAILNDAESRPPSWTRITSEEYANLNTTEKEFYDLMQLTTSIERKSYVATYVDMMEAYHALEEARTPWVMRPLKKHLVTSDSSGTIKDSTMSDEEHDKSFPRMVSSHASRRLKKEHDQPQKFFRRGWFAFMRS